MLAASKTVGIEAIDKRFGLFGKTHRSYVAAQKTVDAAEQKLRAAQARVGECDAEQDDAVYAVATLFERTAAPKGKRKRSAKGKGPAQGPVAAEAEKTGTAG